MAEGLAGLAANTSFNPYSQEFVLIMPDGVTGTAISIDNVFVLQNLAVNTGIIHGIQIGISALLLTVLVLMTKPEKRRSIVFIFNLSAVLLVLLRSILICVTLRGPYFNFYNWATGYYPEDAALQSTIAQSLATEIVSFLVLVAVELSLLFQTRIVCTTIPPRYRIFISISCVLVALTTIAVRFTAMVMNAMWSILNPQTATLAQLELTTRMVKVFNGCTMASIIFFSTVFCSKLAHAIYKRRQMGMKQFGPMQIIFVMGCQTLFIPVVFGILAFYILPSSQLYTMMMCIVATFLPLSSIWASTNTGNKNIAAPNRWRDRRQSSTSTGEKSAYATEKALLPSSVNTSTLIGSSDRGDSISSPGSKKCGHYASASRDSRDSIDLEMAKMGHRIKVNQTYSVRSD